MDMSDTHTLTQRDQNVQESRRVGSARRCDEHPFGPGDALIEQKCRYAGVNGIHDPEG
jgi:hypothetical protein